MRHLVSVLCVFVLTGCNPTVVPPQGHGDVTLEIEVGGDHHQLNDSVVLSGEAPFIYIHPSGEYSLGAQNGTVALDFWFGEDSEMRVPDAGERLPVLPAVGTYYKDTGGQRHKIQGGLLLVESFEPKTDPSDIYEGTVAGNFEIECEGLDGKVTGKFKLPIMMDP